MDVSQNIDLDEAMGQISICHAILDALDVPKLVSCKDNKPGAVHNRLIAYVGVKEKCDKRPIRAKDMLHC